MAAPTVHKPSKALRAAVFANLQLLGLKSIAPELDQDLFLARNQPASEVVFYLLYTRCCPEEAEKEFADCYPVQKKTQEGKFRRVVRQWLTRLEQDPTARVSPIDARVLIQPDQALYRPLLAVSTYVLRVVAQREYASTSSLDPPNPRPASPREVAICRAALQLRVRQCAAEIAARAQAVEALQRRWVACTQALVNEHRSLSQHQQQQQEQKKPVVAADNTAKLARVREGWAQINSTAVATQTGHEVMSRLASDGGERHRLHREHVETTVPAALAPHWADAHRQGVAEELLTGSGEGSVNLAGLTGLWDMALGTVADQLTAAAPGSGSGSPHTSVLSAVVDHAHRVGNARALCAAMESSVRSDTAAAAATVACKPVLETQSAAVAELSRCVSRPERQVDLPPAAS